MEHGSGGVFIQVSMTKCSKRTFHFERTIISMHLFHRFLYRVRGLAAGISAALDYVLRFSSVKTYYNLETSLSMPGISLFNCIIAGFGVILMYNILPETEGHKLEDIELHFSDTTKQITDRKIIKDCSTKGTEMKLSDKIKELSVECEL